MVLILQKSLKSLQLRMNEFMLLLGRETATNSAFTQARANLKHPAFMGSIIVSATPYAETGNR
jgi:hypothetical protein